MQNTEYDPTPKGNSYGDFYPFAKSTFAQHKEIKRLREALNLDEKAFGKLVWDFPCFDKIRGYFKGTMTFAEAETIINYLKRT